MKAGINALIFALTTLILFILSSPVIHCSADDASEPQSSEGMDEDEQEFKRLLSVLDKHTEIATRSRLNADYVPGMVSVLEGADLASRGMRDVGQALQLVPGIEVITGRFGGKTVRVRGVSEAFGFASTKFTLNGISGNNDYTGNYASFLDMPIAQVERIEVIRGPGSAVHGGYANTGVINVITRTEGNAVYAEAGQYETYGAGGLGSWSKPEKDFHISLNLAGRDTDGADTRTGPDAMYFMGQADISNAPGAANEDRSVRSAVMEMAYKNFSIVAQYFNGGYGDYFGSNNVLAPERDTIVFEHTYRMVELSQDVNPGSDLKINVKLGYASYETSTDDRVFLYPAGFVTPLYTYPFGMAYALYYDEQRYQGGVNLTWDGWERHRIFAELFISHTYQGDDTWQAANYDLVSFEPSPTNTMQRYYGALIGEGHVRRVTSIVAQDQISASDNFDITTGLRFDGYNDVADSISPRLAGVWRLSRKHILKAQYAQAYMPPAFYQLYQTFGALAPGNPQLKPQTSKNFELGYIYRGADNVERLTLFHSALDDRIVLRDNLWVNAGGARLTGAELEFEQSFSPTLKLDGNVSYTHTEDRDTGEAIPGTPNWLANFGLSYQAHGNLILNAQYRYVGERNREPQDTRDKLAASHTIDVTGSLHNLFFKGLTLRAGIKNLFDEDVRNAAPINTYVQDYPQPGRWWWAALSYKF